MGEEWGGALLEWQGGAARGDGHFAGCDGVDGGGLFAHGFGLVGHLRAVAHAGFFVDAVDGKEGVAVAEDGADGPLERVG